MAMTKAERAALDKAEHEARLARALRFPTDPVPKQMGLDEIAAAMTHKSVKYGREHTVARGWFYNTYAARVSFGCSDGTFHNKDGDTTSTQTPGSMYRTKAEALRAMRHEKVREVAEILAKIDKQIEDAESECVDRVNITEAICPQNTTSST